MSRAPLMTPAHPRWPEFLEALARAQRCHRTTEHARAALESMEDIDVDRSLFALRELGGHCDCAILFDLQSATPVH